MRHLFFPCNSNPACFLSNSANVSSQSASCPFCVCAEKNPVFIRSPGSVNGKQRGLKWATKHYCSQSATGSKVALCFLLDTLPSPCPCSWGMEPHHNNNNKTSVTSEVLHKQLRIKIFYLVQHNTHSFPLNHASPPAAVALDSAIFVLLSSPCWYCCSLGSLHPLISGGWLLKEHWREACICLTIKFKYPKSFFRIA